MIRLMRSRERPFWRAHYYDFNIYTHKKFVEKLRYIHRNPVRRGLVAIPGSWKWSSFRHYQTGARNSGDSIGVDSPRERLATPRMDAPSTAWVNIAGPPAAAGEGLGAPSAG